MKSPAGFSLGFVCLLCGPLFSAPPTLTSLFPAGAQIGTTTEMTASGNFDIWPLDAWVSDPKITIRCSKDKGKLLATLAPEAKPGLAWLRLASNSGASPLRPFLVGVLPEVQEKEPNDETAKPQTFERSCVVNGKLARGGDVDVFAIPVKKGRTLVASLEANHFLRSPMDAVLQIVSPDGFVLDQNHDHRGLDPQLAYTTSKDGTVLVRVFAFPAQPDSSIRYFGSELCVYRLTLTTDGFADHPVPLARKRGTDLKIESVGWNLSSGPVVPSPVTVRDEDHACFDFTKEPSRDPLTMPFTLTSRIADPGTIHSFSIRAVKGKPFVVQIESRSLELPLTPVLRLLDQSGKPLARAEPSKPNADCELNYAPPQDETLRLEVRDLYRMGGARFVYRLRVVYPEPDFDATIASDRIALVPGTPLEVPLTIASKAGLPALLARDYELMPEGMPPEVKLELVAADTKDKSPAKDRPTKLKFTTSAPKLSSAFRINLTATLKDGRRIVKPILSPMAEFETTTADFWLTASADATVAPPAPKKKK